MAQISVQITADVSSLTAKLALAKAEFQNANAELREMAQKMNAAGASASGELRAGLATAAQAAAQTRAEMAHLNTQLRETSGSGLSQLRSGIEANLAPLKNLTTLAETFAPILVAAFAGERMIESIEHVAELGANLVKLHEQTGVAVEALSGWHYAADQVDVSSEALDLGIKRLGRSIQEALKQPTSNAAQAFEAMGISQEFLRENSNNLQAVLLKVADAFKAHADGANADAVAQAAFGRGGVEMIPFLRQGSEEIERQTQKQKDLGSQMTGPMAEAMLKHRQAVKDMQEAWKGVEISIGSALTGPLTELAHQLEAIAKAASWVGTQWQKFKDLLNSLPHDPRFGKPFDDYMAAKSGATIAPAAVGGASSPPKSSPEGEAKKPEFGNFAGAATKDYFQQWKEQLDQQLISLQLFGRDAEHFELNYWQQKLSVASAGGKNYEGARRELYSRIYQLESAQNRETLSDEERLRQAQIARTREAVAAFERAAAEFKQYLNEEWAAYSENVKDQLQLATGNFAEQRRLAQQWVAEGKELYGDNVRNYKAALDEIRAINKAEVEAQMKPWENLVNGIGNAFDQMLRGVLQGTQSLQQMLARMAQNVILTFANMALKAGEHWILQKVRELLVTQQTEALKTAAVAAGEGARTGIKTAAAVEGKAAEAAAGSASVFGDANKAAAGAFSAVAGIPYVGPILAPIAAATAFGAVLAFDVFSAAGGMDVGAGVNPLTQLHEKEMVLPAPLSERVRNMTEPGGGDVHLHYGPNVNAPQHKTLEQILERESATMVSWIKANIRDGRLKMAAA